MGKGRGRGEEGEEEAKDEAAFSIQTGFRSWSLELEAIDML